MPLDHDAIYKAYKGIVVQIDDDIGARDKNGNIKSIDFSHGNAYHTLT